MSVRIIVDSTVDAPSAIRSRCEIVPLSVRFGDTEYIDGIDINHTAFYEKLVESAELPTTSQPTPDAFTQAYKKALKEGHEILVLTLSSALSGTYQSASIAAMDFPGKVHVVDSKNIAMGIGALAEMALNLADQGKSAKEIADILTVEREKLCLVAVVDTLEYLKKGGRISKTVAFAGELLSVKPMIRIENGEIKIPGKARGLKQANVQINKLIMEMGEIDFSKPILLGYTGLSDIPVRKYMEENQDLWGNCQDRVCQIGSVIGTHAGPGAYAVACFCK